MQRRRDDGEPTRRYSGEPAKQRADLEIFERDYTIERFTQRELMLDMAAFLWFLTAFTVITAGQFNDAVTFEPWMIAYRIIAAIVSLAIGFSLLTVVRRLDDERTQQVIGAVAYVAVLINYGLSFFGTGSIAIQFLAILAVTIFAAQFLSVRTIIGTFLLSAVTLGLSVWHNYNLPGLPYYFSQSVLMIVVQIPVVFAIYTYRNDRMRSLEEAERAAFSDTLTGLPNTRMIRRRADALLDSRNQRIYRQAGLVMLDLDGFRAANTLRGHRVGDDLLVSVADALRTTGDSLGHLVSRTGSDEFTVLIGNTSAERLREYGELYRSVARGAIERIRDLDVNVDVSVGVALSEPAVGSFDAMMRAADRSIYREKSESRREPSLPPASRPGASALGPIPESKKSQSTDKQRKPSRLGYLAWSKRDVQTQFLASAWFLSGLAVALSMRMPDAVPHNHLVVNLLVTFALLTSIVIYITPPARTLVRQAVDVLLASGTLALTLWVTGKSASPALPIELLVLIYIGWFTPLRLFVPTAALSMAIVLAPALLTPSGELLRFDAVTTFGGVLIATSMLVLLYYNHYYIDRAQSLTQQLSSLDPRTGAYNRRAFEERVDEELEQLSYADRDALALVMVDLGDFKSVAGSHGRRVADRLLTDVALALGTASRDEDCVARLGGDLFGVVAPGVDAESARTLAQRLVSSVHEALADHDLAASEAVRASAGFALYGMHGRTADELVTAAEIALTAAKTSGRDPNRVSSFVVAL